MTYNLGKNRDQYYRQSGSGPGRNEINPNGTCKPTATVEALDIAGWYPEKFVAGTYRQPEDNLTDTCNSLKGKSFKSVPGTPGNELWEVVTGVINNYYYKDHTPAPIIGPRWNWDIREVLWGIATLGRPFAASTWLARSGHIVVVKGFSTEQDEMPVAWRNLDMAKITEIIIDDPAGRPKVDGHYDFDADGFNVSYTIGDWSKYWRSTGIQIRNAGEIA